MARTVDFENLMAGVAPRQTGIGFAQKVRDCGKELLSLLSVSHNPARHGRFGGIPLLMRRGGRDINKMQRSLL